MEATSLIGAKRHHLELRHLSRSFGSVAAVNDASLDVDPGQFVSVLGPSGCGKTTLLRMVAGLVQPSAGEIWLDGSRIDQLPPYRRSMGLVFQNYALFPHLSVRGNIAFGLEMRREGREEIRRRVGDVLDLVRMPALGDRRVRQLSGGQQQRVALARALVIRPNILLLDEPFSNVDAKLRVQLRSELSELQRKLQITTLFVTHDQSEAIALGDRLIVMHDGKIVQDGTPESVYDRPVSRFVAEFVGRANFFSGQIESVDHEFARFRIGSGVLPINPRGATVGTATVMVRPHLIDVNTEPGGDGGLKGNVKSVQFEGDHLRIEVAIGAQVVEVTQTATHHSFVTGTAVTLSWQADSASIVE